MKALILALAVVLVLLSGCATQPQVNWVKVSSIEEASSLCTFAKGKNAAYVRVKGCQYWSGKTCTVVAPDCAENRDMACFGVLGHEMKHCLEGGYHS